MICDLCPHMCQIPEGGVGLCKARGVKNGRVSCLNYGRVTGIAIRPITDVPLRLFYPESGVVTIGSFGCNMNCRFCDTYEISASGAGVNCSKYTAAQVAEGVSALRGRGSIGGAFMYNEPLVGYEFILDCARLIREKYGQKVVLKTNGYINPGPLEQLLPWIDAMNIDLKGFSGSIYQRSRGDVETVKATVSRAVEVCHVEVSTPVVPGYNDSAEETGAMARWLAALDPHMALHLVPFKPAYKMWAEKPTSPECMARAAEAAGEHLKNVFIFEN